MKRITKPMILAGLLVASILGMLPVAHAGIDLAFGARVPLGDDGSLFVNISSRYFERDPSVIQAWGRRFEDPDDLAVFFWITERSRKSADFVFSLRRQGLGWFEIGNRCGVPVDAWYVAVPVEKPGPPYGKAYGHWKKHQQNPNYRVKLNDRQARDLVAVRMGHEYYRVPAEVAMDWRRAGEDVRSIMNREYRTRHGQDGKSSAAHGKRGGGQGRGAKKH